MGKREFIRKYRAEIDAVINGVMYRHDGNGGRGVIPDPPPTYNDHERELWLVNDGDLWNWARSCGVRL